MIYVQVHRDIDRPYDEWKEATSYNVSADGSLHLFSVAHPGGILTMPRCKSVAVYAKGSWLLATKEKPKFSSTSTR